MIDLTVTQIKQRLNACNAQEFAVLERSLMADTRKGVVAALNSARRRLDAQAAEAARLAGMYEFDAALLENAGAGTSGVVLGLDEVGRGPLAGPLAVGGVVLGGAQVALLNDSKKLTHAQREQIATDVKARALAYTVQYVEPQQIDKLGMTAALKQAFCAAIDAIEAQGIVVDVVALDGNPLHLDAREVNIVKGDAKSASIAAASCVAKVDRDALMDEYSAEFPQYNFSKNKGYGTADHIAAIKEFGLCKIHRQSFCSGIIQPTLF
jgi:ribonuclease HII